MAKDINIEFFREKGWLKLDNAAKLYPAIISKDLTSVFRITAILKETVKYSAIQEAVTITSLRFPYFSVSLGSGMFWHYLEFNNRVPRIQVEEEIPCTAFAVKRKNEPLYRVLIKKNRISVEFIHILTDGTGAMEYLKSLLYSYFTLMGKHISSPGGIIMPGTPVSSEEMEDSYMKYFKKLPPPSSIKMAWHLPFKLNKRPRLRVMHVEVNLNQILNQSHKFNVSITEYFISVYFLSLQEIFLSGKKNSRKVLRIEAPVNMRNKLPSRTMRNFTLFVLPEIDLRLGTYTFEEILRFVHYQMQLSADIKQIGRFLSQNVSYEKLLFVRALPLFIKKISIAAVYRGLASKRFSGIVTNMGLIRLPQEMEEMLDNFELIPPPPNPKVKVGCAMVSFNNKLRICFSNLTDSNELERRILKHLTGAGINVKILSGFKILKMIICNNCGVELDDNLKICPLCGKDPLSATEDMTLNNPSGILQLHRREVRKSLWELAGIIAFCSITVCTIVDLVTNRKPVWSLFSDVSIIAAWLILTLFLHAYRRPLIIIPGMLFTILAALFAFDQLSEGREWFLPVALPLTLSVFGVTGIILVLYRAAHLKGLNILALSILVLSGLCIITEILLDRFLNGFVELQWSLIVAISIFPVSLLLLFYHYRLKRGNRLDSYFHI